MFARIQSWNWFCDCSRVLEPFPSILMIVLGLEMGLLRSLNVFFEYLSICVSQVHRVLKNSLFDGEPCIDFGSFWTFDSPFFPIKFCAQYVKSTFTPIWILQFECSNSSDILFSKIKGLQSDLESLKFLKIVNYSFPSILFK